MSINAITANNNLNAASALAKQYQPVPGAGQENPFFRRDSLSLGNVASPYQTYTAAARAPVNEGWCIEDHYLCAPEEVDSRLSAIF